MAEQPRLTFEQANTIYDILIRHAGADETGRKDFVFAETYPGYHYCDLYRFQGALGFGGTFWHKDGRWYVTTDPEDVAEQPERNNMIQVVNAQLAAAKAASETSAGENG
ncbi:hypothetical protein ACGF5C_11915 [Micromonospora sp. NPDC047620]|uniref:hypothetical protein n=1 Tax=Micromonospora sp. NPDC047620 TaxID=3364251 RepID=UPI00371C21C9